MQVMAELLVLLLQEHVLLKGEAVVVVGEPAWRSHC